MTKTPLMHALLKILEDNKAIDITILHVSHLTQMTDDLIICTGSSSRHTRTLAKELYKYIKLNKSPFLGMEGEDTGEWVLLDLVDIMVHVMLTSTREYYQLEKLWQIDALESNPDNE